MFDNCWRLQAMNEEFLHFLSIHNTAVECRKYDECDNKPTIFQLIPDLQDKEDALASAKLEAGCLCDLNINHIKSLLPYLCQQDDEESPTHTEYSQMYFWVESHLFQRDIMASTVIFKPATKSFERTDTKIKDPDNRHTLTKGSKYSAQYDDGSASTMSCMAI